MSTQTSACRPVEWPSTGPLANEKQTPVYPGSVRGECETCQQAIWIGPKVQAMMLRTKIRLLCFMCVMKHYTGRNPTIVDLGNTYQPRKDDA